MPNKSSKTRMVSFRLPIEVCAKIEKAFENPRNPNTSIGDYCKSVVTRHAFRHEKNIKKEGEIMRTKGAVNKPKSDSVLISELEKRGYSIGKAGTVKGETPPAIIEAAEKQLKITKPKIAKTVTENETKTDSGGAVLRCGNPACGKVLTSELSKCPHCGCKLEW